jgi:hypothetical protein
LCFFWGPPLKQKQRVFFFLAILSIHPNFFVFFKNKTPPGNPAPFSCRDQHITHLLYDRHKSLRVCRPFWQIRYYIFITCRVGGHHENIGGLTAAPTENVLEKIQTALQSFSNSRLSRRHQTIARGFGTASVKRYAL